MINIELVFLSEAVFESLIGLEASKCQLKYASYKVA